MEYTKILITKWIDRQLILVPIISPFSKNEVFTRYVYQTQLNNPVVCFNERRFTTRARFADGTIFDSLYKWGKPLTMRIGVGNDSNMHDMKLLNLESHGVMSINATIVRKNSVQIFIWHLNYLHLCTLLSTYCWFSVLRLFIFFVLRRNLYIISSLNLKVCSIFQA